MSPCSGCAAVASLTPSYYRASKVGPRPSVNPLERSFGSFCCKCLGFRAFGTRTYPHAIADRCMGADHMPASATCGAS